MQSTGHTAMHSSQPVQCISLENVTGKLTGWAAWSEVQADQALERYTFHSCLRSDLLGQNPKTPLKTTRLEIPNKLSVIEAALAKSRDQRTK